MKRTHIELDISALQHNFQRIQQLTPHSKKMAIIKANAYGHGAEKIAKGLPQADAFGVTCLNEAIHLRNNNIKQDIVLMQGFNCVEDLSSISSHHLQIVLHDWNQLNILEQQHLSVPLTIWLKIDTGMHRLGFNPQAMPEIINRLQKINSNVKHLRFMTHFASSEQLDNPLTQNQYLSFLSATEKLSGLKCLANSAAILAWPNTHADWVRPGVILYGVSPFPHKIGNDHDLKPVMNWCSTLMVINQLKKGDGVGYNRTWICPEDMPVGIVAAGYGDGYPRQAGNGTPVLVNNIKVPLIGRVSMDMLAVDLRTQPNAKAGDPVILWGKNLPVEEIARATEMSPYQLLCGVRLR
jgi:alanine racemase